jgi:hypothetical protein
MKKSIILAVSVIFLFVCVALPAHAAKTYSTKEITGVIKKIELRVSKDLGPDLTIIKFKDGRTITSKGIYNGLTFEKGKKCTVKYQYVDFALGPAETYIESIKCQK